MRQELLDSHIGVSCVQPGGIKTNIIKSSRYTTADNTAATKEEFISRFNEFAGLTSEQAAEQIRRGVLANKAQILVGRDAKTAAIVERIAPTGYQTLLSKLVNSLLNDKST